MVCVVGVSDSFANIPPLSPLKDQLEASSIDEYAEFDFIVFGSLSLKQQIEHEIPVEDVTCKNDDHHWVQRTNGKLACAESITADKLDWKSIDVVNANLLE